MPRRVLMVAFNNAAFNNAAFNVLSFYHGFPECAKFRLDKRFRDLVAVLHMDGGEFQKLHGVSESY